MVNIQHKKMVVIGGGKVAAKRIMSLLRFQPNITVVSPTLEKGLRSLVAKGAIHYESRKFQLNDIQGAFIVIAATDDPQVNQVIRASCQINQLINIVDDPVNSSFHFPAIYENNEISVAVTTNGISPMLAKNLRDEFASIVDGIETEYLLFLKEVRQLVKEGRFSKEQKRFLLTECLEDDYQSDIKLRTVFLEKLFASGKGI